jgi:hypothetical protein
MLFEFLSEMPSEILFEILELIFLMSHWFFLSLFSVATGLIQACSSPFCTSRSG